MICSILRVYLLFSVHCVSVNRVKGEPSALGTAKALRAGKNCNISVNGAVRVSLRRYYGDITV